MPTTNRLSTKGRLASGPAIIPTSTAPAISSPKSRTARLPCPDCPSRAVSPSRLPRGASNCNTRASASGRPIEPRARYAPGPPMSVPTRNGRSGTGIAQAGCAPPGSPERPQDRRVGGRQEVVDRRGPRRALARLDEPIEAPRPTHQLHHGDRRVEGERRDDATPDQIQPGQPIGELRDPPEQRQADRGPRQPSERRRAVHADRRADLGRLRPLERGVIGRGVPGEHPLRIDVVRSGGEGPRDRGRQGDELGGRQPQGEHAERRQRALQHPDLPLDREAEQPREHEQDGQGGDDRTGPPDRAAEGEGRPDDQARQARRSRSGRRRGTGRAASSRGASPAQDENEPASGSAACSSGSGVDSSSSAMPRLRPFPPP